MARKSWLDETGQKTLVDEYVQRLGSFVEALADGVVDAQELQQQEARVVALMKALEPQLDDATHAKVTELLCELSAYNLMQVLQDLQAARPATVFQP